MNRAELTRLLNLTYEMEGLTELALKRQPDTPEEIYRLIAEKAYLIANTAAAAQESTPDVARAPAAEAPGIPDLQTLLEEKKQREPENDDAARELMADAETMYIPTEEASALEDVFDDDEPQSVETGSAATSNPAPAPGRRRPLKAFFSINDNYLYRRELFGNNDRDFRASMHLLENMDSAGEAEEYLYTDLQFDPENPRVAEFVEILRHYYGQERD